MRYTSSRNVLMPPLAVIWLVAGCVACWTLGYYDSVGFPVYEETGATPLWNLLCHRLTRQDVAYGLGFLLTVGGAFFIHRANYVLMLIREKTLLPFWIYLLLGSTNPDFFPLKASSIGVFCLVLAMYQLFIAYHDPESHSRAFNAGWIIGLGSLLWIYILWFVPLFWVGMYKFRSLSWRTFLATLIGVGAVYWLVLGWCVWSGDYAMLEVPARTLLHIHPLQLLDTAWTDWTSVVYTVVLAVAASVNILSHEHDDNLRSRQYLSFLIWACLWSLLLFFLYEQSFEEFLAVMGLPASILIGHLFAVIKKRYMFWTYHLSILLYFFFFAIRIWNF